MSIASKMLCCLVTMMIMKLGAAGFDYSEAVDKSLMFFEAQRSGYFPSNQRVKWRANSGLRDGFHQGVGDGDSDHYCWERAEGMRTPRTSYKVDHLNPGFDLAAEAAAAMFAASIAFRPYNSSYSDLLRYHAKQQQKKILIRNIYVAENAASMGGTGWAVKQFSWDNKYAGVQVLLSKVLLERRGGTYTSILKQYQAKADFFACACLQKNAGDNVATTPGGLRYVSEWINNLQYAASAAFLLAVYLEYLSQFHTMPKCPDPQLQSKQLLDFAQSQADYMLGKNPKYISYIVGKGQKYPTHVHHRGASIPSISVLHSTVQCVQGFETWYHRSQANPNVIHGALVGGPGKYDDFSDDHSNYEQTEPTLSGTAPLVGLFSKLQSVIADSGVF